MVKETLLDDSAKLSSDFSSREKKIARREVWQKVGVEVLFAAPLGR